MGGEDAFMDLKNFIIFLQETLAINLTTVTLPTGGRERLFHLSIIPRGEKSEDTDHLTPPTEAAPVGQPRNTGGLDPDQLFLRRLCLGLLRDNHWSAHADKPSDSIQGKFMSKSHKKLLSDVWLDYDSPCRHSINIITSFLFWTNITVSWNRCHGLLSVRALAKEPRDPKWNKIIRARIEGRKTQFMKPAWQPIKYLRQLFARWPRSMRRDWEWDVNHAGGRCSCCLCLHVVKALRFLP